MAYRNSGNEPHAYKKIEEELKGGKLGSPLFFYGKERYLVDWAISSIVNKYVNPAVKELDFNKSEAGDLNFALLRNQCETLPMMSEKRVVLVEGFVPLAGGKLKSFGEEEEQQMTEYLGNLPESCILIFTAETADKRRKLYKSVEKHGGCYDFKQLNEKLLKGWIEKQFRKAGKTVRPSVISQLISISGYYDKDTDYTLYNLENDLRKAIAHSEGEEVRAEDVLGTVSANLETDVFAMIDFMSQGRKDEAFRLLHNLFLSGEKEYRLLALICSQLEIILSVKEMKEEGKTYNQMQEILGVHEFRIKKGAMFAGRYEMPHLRRALIKAYEIDKNIKTGIMDGQLALELLVVEM